MRVGPLHVTLTGDFDQVGEQPLCLVLIVWRLVFGVEGRIGWRRDELDATWLWIYAGWWLIEFYWDASWDGFYKDDPA